MDGLAKLIARLTLGFVMVPHAASKLFTYRFDTPIGVFEGRGWSATIDLFTKQMHLPTWMAAAVILVEFLGALALLAGFATRLAAAGMIGIMIGAIVKVHFANGFWMNWRGDQKGEGFEYHILFIALALVVVLGGGGIGAARRRSAAPSAAPQ